MSGVHPAGYGDAREPAGKRDDRAGARAGGPAQPRTLSSLRGAEPADTVVLMMEVADETTYVPHHRRKIAYLSLRGCDIMPSGWGKLGWHGRLCDGSTIRPTPAASPARSRGRWRGTAPNGSSVTEAGEWRVRAMLDGWAEAFGAAGRGARGRSLPLLPRRLRRLGRRASPARSRMEWFYREMRAAHRAVDGRRPARRRSLELRHR